MTHAGHLIFLLVSVSLIPLGTVESAVTKLVVSPSTSNDGVAKLSWHAPSDTAVSLQQSTNSGFSDARTIYHGPDTATTVTGLADGRYFYRAALNIENEAPPGWSEPVELTVTHHSLTKAFTFFTLGVIVFLATLIMIMTGSKGKDPTS